MLQAILEAWWALPRELRRHQLLQTMAGDKEPGDRVVEGVGFVWEEANVPARNFFAKVLGRSPAYAEGSFVGFDRKEAIGEGDIVQWTGILTANPQDSGR